MGVRRADVVVTLKHLHYVAVLHITKKSLHTKSCQYWIRKDFSGFILNVGCLCFDPLLFKGHRDGGHRWTVECPWCVLRSSRGLFSSVFFPWLSSVLVVDFDVCCV